MQRRTRWLWAIGSFGALCAVVLVARFLHRQNQHHNYLRCLMNIQVIDAAKSDWAASNGYTMESFRESTYEPTSAQIEPFVKQTMKLKGFQQLRGTLKCPSGGKYIIGRLSEDPGCTYKKPVKKWGIRLYHKWYYWPDNPLLNKEVRRYYPQEPYVPEGTNVLSVVTVP
jgi:hypothetical protein